MMGNTCDKCEAHSNGQTDTTHGVAACCPPHRFVQECARRGLLVMLDMHRLAAAKDIPELW